MLLQSIELRDFTSYENEKVDLSGVNIASLTGVNGAGKSSLLDAVLFALFGDGTKGKSLDDYVRQGTMAGGVILEFVLHGQTYRAERTRSIAKNKTYSRLMKKVGSAWEDVGGKSISETQKSIEALLRMDYKTFSASSLILQGQSDNLTNDMTDAERKEILARILGLDLWDSLQEKVKEQVRVLKGKIQCQETEMQILQKQVEQKDFLVTAKSNIDESIEGIRKEIQDTEESIADLSSKLAQKPMLEKCIADLRKEYSDSTKAIEELTSQEKKLCFDSDKINTKLESIDMLLRNKEAIEGAVELEKKLSLQVKGFDEKAQQYTSLRDNNLDIVQKAGNWNRTHDSTIAQYEAQVKTATKQSEVLDKVPCGDELKTECPLLKQAQEARKGLQKATTLLDLERSNTNPFTKEIKAIEEAIKELSYDRSEHSNLRKALEEIRGDALMKAEIDTAVTQKEDLNTRITEISQALNELYEKKLRHEQSKQSVEKQGLQYKTELRALEETVKALDDQKVELKTTRQALETVQSSLGKISAQLEQIEQAEIILSPIQEQIKGLKDELFCQSLLEEACSKRGGVPALIIENAVPQIEALANDILSHLANGRFQVRLDTQAETKTTGKMQEVLRIIILDQGNERHYLTYSGAEKFMVDLALRIGISKFLTQRSGAEIELLVIDEGMGSLDDTNRMDVIEAIRTASAYFGKVLLITHIDELKDAFPQRIEVSRNGQGSKVRVVT